MRHVLLSAVYALILVTVFPALAGEKKAASAPPLDAWVLLHKDDHDVHMSGSTSDIRVARAQQQADEPLLWVRRGDKTWVIRDAAVLAKVDALWAPLDALGKKMDALGKKMEPLGKQMEALGDKMRDASSDDEREAIGRDMDAIGKQMDAVGKEMDALGREMDRASHKAEADLAVVVDDAIKSGKAQAAKSPL